MNKETKGVASLFAAGFFYAFYGVFSRLMGGKFDTFFQAWSRGVIVAIIFLLIGFFNKSFKKIQSKDYKWFLLSALGGSLTIGPFYVAVLHMPIGIALLIFYAANTIFAYILGNLLFGERINNKKYIALLCSLIGLVFVYYESIRFYDLLYILNASFSGLMFTLFYLGSKKVNKTYSSAQINFFIFGVLFIINLTISLVLNESFYWDFSSKEWLANLGYVIVQVAAAFLVISGFKKVEAQIGSLVLLSEVIFTVIFGYIFFKEVPGFYSILGGLLIIIAMALPNLSKYENKN